MGDKLVDKVDDSKFKYVERKPTKAQRRKVCVKNEIIHK